MQEQCTFSICLCIIVGKLFPNLICLLQNKENNIIASSWDHKGYVCYVITGCPWLNQHSSQCLQAGRFCWCGFKPGLHQYASSVLCPFGLMVVYEIEVEISPILSFIDNKPTIINLKKYQVNTSRPFDLLLMQIYCEPDLFNLLLLNYWGLFSEWIFQYNVVSKILYM